MTNYKELLRLHSLGINNTRVAENCGCARSAVISTVQRAQEMQKSAVALSLLWVEYCEQCVKGMRTESCPYIRSRILSAPPLQGF